LIAGERSMECGSKASALILFRGKRNDHLQFNASVRASGDRWILSAYPKNRPFDTRCALLRMRFFGILRYSDRL